MFWRASDENDRFKSEEEEGKKEQRALKILIHAIQERSSLFGNGEDICWGKVT